MFHDCLAYSKGLVTSGSFGPSVVINFIILCLFMRLTWIALRISQYLTYIFCGSNCVEVKPNKFCATFDLRMIFIGKKNLLWILEYIRGLHYDIDQNIYLWSYGSSTSSVRLSVRLMSFDTMLISCVRYMEKLYKWNDKSADQLNTKNPFKKKSTLDVP